MISRERWHLTAQESSAVRQELLAGRQGFFAPGFDGRSLVQVRLVNGDNFLSLDLRHNLDRQLLIEELGRPGTHVIESNDDESVYATAQKGEQHTHEVAITFLGPDTCGRRSAPVRLNIGPKSQNYYPGGRWLYYKLFSDDASLESVMVHLFDHIETQISQGDLRSVFYVRYGIEAERHFRLRLDCGSEDKAQHINSTIIKHLSTAVEDQKLDRFDISTYQPEIARYGGQLGVAISERVFSIDSAAAIKALALSNSIPRWKVALISIWRMARVTMGDLRLDDVLAGITKAYAAEFRLKGERLRILDRQYRERRSTIAAIVSGQDEELHALRGIFDERDFKVAVAFKELVSHPIMADPSFLSSHLHMCANRLLGPDGRMEEAVLLTHLYRHLRSDRARTVATDGAARAPLG